MSKEAIARFKTTEKLSEKHRDALTLLIDYIASIPDPTYILVIVDPILTTVKAVAESTAKFWKLIETIKAQAIEAGKTEQDIADNTSNDEARRLLQQTLDQISFIPLARGIEALDPHLFEPTVKEVASHLGGAAQLKALRRAIDGVDLEK